MDVRFAVRCGLCPRINARHHEACHPAAVIGAAPGERTDVPQLAIDTGVGVATPTRGAGLFDGAEVALPTAGADALGLARLAFALVEHEVAAAAAVGASLPAPVVRSVEV